MLENVYIVGKKFRWFFLDFFFLNKIYVLNLFTNMSNERHVHKLVIRLVFLRYDRGDRLNKKMCIVFINSNLTNKDV